MKYYLIANPVAGPGVAEKRIKEELSLSTNSIDYEIYLTKAKKDATDFVSKKIQENNNEEICFIAIGGDGTINEVFESCVKKENVYVSCLPSGSGNDFVKCFKGKTFSLKNIVEGTSKKIDVFKVNDRICVNVCNFGIETGVAKYVNDQRDIRGYGKKSDYIVGAVKALFKSTKSNVEVYADNQLLNHDGIISSCALCNGQYVGGSFHCGPKAELDDGYIDVCLVKGIGVLQFIQFIGPYQKGKHLDNPKMKDLITYKRVKHLEIIAKDSDFAYSLDGEIIDTKHFKCEMIEKGLNFIVPKE